MNPRDRYLADLEGRLRLRGSRRAEALAEIAAHIDDGVASGKPEGEVVARLGAPRQLAAGFNRRERARLLPAVLTTAFVFAVAATIVAARTVPAPTDPAEGAVVVPNVIGMDAADAHRVLEQSGLRWTWADGACAANGFLMRDTIYAQGGVGTRVPPGTTIMLVSASGKMYVGFETCLGSVRP